MKSKKLILGAAGTGLLASVAIIFALLGHAAMATVVEVLLMAAIAILLCASVLTQRRTARDVSRLLRHGAQVGTYYSAPPAVTEPDLVGALRMLQAQYVGRLDRAQAAFERAAAELATPGTHADVVVPGAGGEYVPVVEAALAAGLRVAVVADGSGTVAWVEGNGWTDKVAIVGVAGPPRRGA